MVKARPSRTVPVPTAAAAKLFPAPPTTKVLVARPVSSAACR